MIGTELIAKHLNNTITETDFPMLGTKYRGKVRDNYVMDDKLFMITTDRQSAFDRILANVPFKGQVLSQTSAFWFDATKDIIPNHMISTPDPNIIICKKLKVFPVEVVVRGYLTGVTSTAVWTAYQKGERVFCGNKLADGMIKNQMFDRPIITPTTKSDQHDEKISAQEVVRRNLMSLEQWDYIVDKAFKLFTKGTEIAKKNGLILVDTKYEFGYDEDGRIYLADEIHTPDSSRYWIEKTYNERFSQGKEPENIDKEFLRLWFTEHCDPYNDPELPKAPDELVIELCRRYIMLFELITGNTFEINSELDVNKRIKENLMKEGYLKE
jgi:phosphoribosylaminoimidazole-succinocarboxamide synthase